MGGHGWAAFFFLRFLQLLCRRSHLRTVPWSSQLLKPSSALVVWIRPFPCRAPTAVLAVSRAAPRGTGPLAHHLVAFMVYGLALEGREPCRIFSCQHALHAFASLMISAFPRKK